MIQLHSIHRLRVHPLPNSSAAQFLSCTIQEMHWESLSEKGANLYRLLFQYSANTHRIEGNQCKESGLRLGVPNGRNETQVYRTREYTGPKNVRPVLRKSRITKAFNPSALGRHSLCLRKACAGNAPAPGFPAGRLRPCSRVNASLYGRITNASLRKRKAVQLRLEQTFPPGPAKN